jgi:A/G-specific adenine glycosylase
MTFCHLEETESFFVMSSEVETSLIVMRSTVRDSSTALGMTEEPLPHALIPPEDLRPFRRALLAWYRKNGRDLPWRHTRDPYAILVSELMLQQTQVATVIPYYRRWLERFPDFASLARATDSDVLHAWQGLGYYARARNLHAAAKLIIARHRGILPHHIDQIRALPGLGRYTTNAVATFAFDQSLPIAEANIARLLARVLDLQTPIDSAAGREQIWSFAFDLLPERDASTHNSALMDLGALICTARQPKCGICPVRNFCRATDPASLPQKRARPRTVELEETHGFVFRNGRILLEQSRARWRGMWILPPLEPLIETQPALHHSEFPFTHHRVRLSVFAQDVPARLHHSARRWFPIEAVDSIPMPSPHRRALNAIIEQHLVPPTDLA